jgi:hypothetical protein
MDYLDHQKQLRERILLFTGYVLVAVAITLSALVLLRLAAGYDLDKKGAIIQKGLTFFSSHPRPADIYVDGKKQTVRTNTRLLLPAGIYDIQLKRAGYYDWQRKIELDGGTVQHYDYPFLIPTALTTKKIQSFTAATGFMTQSPDHRWLLVQEPASLRQFSLYDLKSPDRAADTISLPAVILTKSVGAEAWQLVEWADDNQHALLKHVYDDKYEYILVDRANPDQSINLTSTLSANPAKLSLIDKKYDRYYLFDASTLQSASLGDTTPKPLLQHVIDFKSYGSNTILYVTDSGAPAGKVELKILSGTKTYDLRSLPAGTSYVLDLTKYSDVMYVAAGSATGDRVYIYKDPVGQLSALPDAPPLITQVLHVPQVSYLSFSASAQFIVAENGTRFGVYDIENKDGYNYTAAAPLDSPQPHATWMDGNRLVYVSGGKLIEFDYDNLNFHALMPADPNYLPAFTPDYKFVYSLAPVATGQDLTQTSLLAPADR